MARQTPLGQMTGDKTRINARLRRTKFYDEVGHRAVWAALIIAANLLPLTVFTATAQASEAIESFKTTSAETNAPAPPSYGEPVTSGIVEAEPSGESFKIETHG
jgi:hypothetical protein